MKIKELCQFFCAEKMDRLPISKQPAQNPTKTPSHPMIMKIYTSQQILLNNSIIQTKTYEVLLPNQFGTRIAIYLLD
jgi:hypothetical protein